MTLEQLGLSREQAPTMDVHIRQGCVNTWEPIFVKWETTSRTEPTPRLRCFDFVALHRAHEPPDDYLASLYTLGNLQGEAALISPSEPGMYKISVVRDLRQVLQGMAVDVRRFQDQDQLDRLVVLGTSPSVAVSPGGVAESKIS